MRKAVTYRRSYRKISYNSMFPSNERFVCKLQYLFEVSKQLMSVIVPEVCGAPIEVLKENVKVKILTIHIYIIYIYL